MLKTLVCIVYYFSYLLLQVADVHAVSPHQLVVNELQLDPVFGDHPGRTVIDLSPENCPLSSPLQKARRQDLFEKLQNENEQGKAFSGFVLGMHWCTSTDEALRKLTQLCELINCPSTDEAHTRRVQEVLSNVHIVEITQHFVGRYLRKVYEVTGLEPSVVNLKIGNKAEDIKVDEFKHLRDSCAQVWMP